MNNGEWKREERRKEKPERKNLSTSENWHTEASKQRPEVRKERRPRTADREEVRAFGR